MGGDQLGLCQGQVSVLGFPPPVAGLARNAVRSVITC